MKNYKYVVWIYIGILAIGFSFYTYTGLKGTTWLKAGSQGAKSYNHAGPGILLHK